MLKRGKGVIHHAKSEWGRQGRQGAGFTTGGAPGREGCGAEGGGTPTPRARGDA